LSTFGLPDAFGKPLAVVLIDLLLAGDNAVMIALVCVSLALTPSRQRTVLALGTLFAVVLRIALVAIGGQLLAVPGLRLVGGLALAVLAVNLARPRPGPAHAAPALDAGVGLFGIAVLIALIDLLMSLDNVLALAAVAGDTVLYLAVGLAISIAILMFGTGLVARLLRRFPDLVWLGTALLGWVAGQMVVDDRLVAGWVATQSPALGLIVPALTGLYVYLLHGEVVPQPIEPARPRRRAVTPPAARTSPPVPPPAAPLRAPSAAPVTDMPPPDAGAPSSSVELMLFLALAGVVGLVLGVLLLFGGGRGL
jgi:YjbE family integral membrane protein